MKIEVRVYPVNSESKLKAFVSVTADEVIVMNGFKLVEGKGGRLFLASPANKIADGQYKDITYFLKRECHEYVEKKAADEYNKLVNKELDNSNPFTK